ncbi:MAG: aminotransferase class I/II-fold pyridoxal phosphate-dependent enzyme [Lachnospiraceae bacterium]|nr:aminotransferase class I/II-fold pyridoxal phosphate-dependent enzyme [Lachnospiraceae bacterium]
MSWEKNVRKVTPYIAGEQPQGKVIKLNTNEFPYAPSPMVATKIYDLAQEELDGSSSMLRKYPDMDATKLVNAIVSVYNELYFSETEATEEMKQLGFDNVFVGVGSDDVLAMAFMTFFNSDKPVLFPDITYSFYDVWADVHRIPYATQALTDDFSIDINDYMDKENGGIVIPNPNAPTGVYEDPSKFEDIVRANPDSVVIIDEAYVDFGGESCLPLINKYDNVLVVQTFSKSRALAGLRIGVAFGNEKLIKYLKDVKFAFNSYTMNYPAIELATVSVLDTDYWKETVARVIKTREWTKEKLRELDFEFRDSKANFIFASHKSMPAKEIFEKLRKKDIYVRHWNKPRIDNHLRISIGTDEEMKELISTLRTILRDEDPVNT